MHDLIKEHGKLLIGTLLDMIIIEGRLDNERIRSILLQDKVITRNTKYIQTHLYTDNEYVRDADGRGRYLDTKVYSVYVKNGSGKWLKQIKIPMSQLSQIMEDL